MIVLDDLDRKIIHILKENSRMPAMQVARELGVPCGTATFRIKRLMKSDGIKFTVITEPVALCSPDELSCMLDMVEKAIEQQRKETDLIWVAVKGCVRRINHIEGMEGG